MVCENDCDDHDDDINPGVLEGVYGDFVCSDEIDNDCDNDIDINDSGCYECTVYTDCDDSNECTSDNCVNNICVSTNNTIECDDGNGCTMNDACSEGSCVGASLDWDGDGYISDVCLGTDCNDLNSSINPGLIEGPSDSNTCIDGLDNDCDSTIDALDTGCQDGAIQHRVIIIGN